MGFSLRWQLSDFRFSLPLSKLPFASPTLEVHLCPSPLCTVWSRKWLVIMPSFTLVACHWLPLRQHRVLSVCPILGSPRRACPSPTKTLPESSLLFLPCQPPLELATSLPHPQVHRLRLPPFLLSLCLRVHSAQPPPAPEASSYSRLPPLSMSSSAAPVLLRLTLPACSPALAPLHLDPCCSQRSPHTLHGSVAPTSCCDLLLRPAPPPAHTSRPREATPRGLPGGVFHQSHQNVIVPPVPSVGPLCGPRPRKHAGSVGLADEESVLGPRGCSHQCHWGPPPPGTSCAHALETHHLFNGCHVLEGFYYHFTN